MEVVCDNPNCTEKEIPKIFPEGFKVFPGEKVHCGGCYAVLYTEPELEDKAEE